MKSNVPPTKVTCAIIEDDGLILLAQRGDHMDLPGKWEFPGGKVRTGESPSACLVREIKEELGIDIIVREALPSHHHSYNHISIELLPFTCSISGGSIILHEHKDVQWADPERVSEFDLAEADIPVLIAYLSRKTSS